MALQTFANNAGILVSPLSGLSNAILGTSTSSSGTVNAAGESVSVIFKIHIDGLATNKVLSAAGGGKIHWIPGSNTFADAGTNLRIGLQDVGATGLEDGTFDVYADLVGGTDTLTNGTPKTTVMETGTKTVNHDDLLALSFEFTTRAGSDTLSFVVSNSTHNFPYRTEDTGAGPTKPDAACPLFTIEFDDGTLGWAFPLYLYTTAGVTYASNSTPDEYALVFKMPVSCTMSRVQVAVGNIGSVDAFEVVIYSDPLGTPSADQTVTIDPNMVGSPFSTSMYSVNITPYSLIKDTYYAIAVRPTTTNSIILARLNFGSGNSNLRGVTMLGTNWSSGSRTNQSGAFTEDTEKIPQINFYISELHDGAGGGSSHTFG